MMRLIDEKAVRRKSFDCPFMFVYRVVVREHFMKKEILFEPV
jgi:hypothetical protein